jgi:hypothetical protein
MWCGVQICEMQHKKEQQKQAGGMYKRKRVQAMRWFRGLWLEASMIGVVGAYGASEVLQMSAFCKECNV